MNIKKILIGQLNLPLTRPFITAVRRTDCVDDVIVMIETDNGKIGYGSAASTPAITGDTSETIIRAIKDILAPQLIGLNISNLNHLLELNIRSLEGNTSAKAAIDMALHDLFAQYCGLPLYKLFGASKNTIQSCITISVKDTENMVKDALEFVQQGHHTLKIKLGLNLQEDQNRISAIRKAVGTEITLLVDANQGWSYEESLKMIRYFEEQKLAISLLEQPVIANDLVALKKIHDQASCTIIADEACFSPADALNLAHLHACGGINIKLMKSGGIAQAQALYHIAKTAQMQVMVGCMLESPIGIAAIASFALSKPDILYADLDPIFLIKENYVMGGAQIKGTQLILPDKPGLGIEGISQGFILIENIK